MADFGRLAAGIGLALDRLEGTAIGLTQSGLQLAQCLARAVSCA